MTSSSGVNKEELYGEYLKEHRRKSRMSEQLARKSLDLPDVDEMQITVDKSRKGLGAKELMAMGVLVAGGAFGGSLLTQQQQQQPAAQGPPPAPAAIEQSHTDTDTINVLDFAPQ